MGIITDFFVAASQDVDATPIHKFPIGQVVYSKGIETLGLDIFARLLTGSVFKNVLEHKKPDYHGLICSDMGEVDPVSAIVFFRQNYTQAELEEWEDEWGETLDEHIDAMEGSELNAWVFSTPTVGQFHSAFVEAIASCSLERLQQIEIQWRQEWADALESPSILNENLLPFWQDIARLAQQALAQKKQMYYYFSL